MNSLKKEGNSWLPDLLVGKISGIVPAQAMFFYTSVQHSAQSSPYVDLTGKADKLFGMTSDFTVFAAHEVVFLRQ